jgi:hypothetical protein
MRDTHQRNGASRLPWLPAGIAVLVGLTAFTLVILHADLAESPGVADIPHAISANSICINHTGGFPGVPAITPYLNLAANAASVASGGIATLPTFTAGDASAWVMAHRAFTAAPGTFTIRCVTFVPQEQACQWANVGLDLGLPAGAPLCVVVLDGTFTVTNPGEPTLTRTYSHVILGLTE